MIAQADPKRGRSYYKQSCIVCHGANYQGMPHQGVSLRDSKFIASNSDEALWNFLKSGRKPTDKASLLKLEMPPRGANPSLDDEDLMDVVVFLRTVSVGEISNSK
jgi:cytochrome c